jgi:N-acetylmuramoyl-L-alanine amidase
METPLTPVPPKSTKKAPRVRNFQNVQSVLLVAFLLATLFTAWTPAELLPLSLAEKLSQSMLPEQEAAAEIWPTMTPRPHLRIGIVAGHWGSDSGAVCPDGLTEVEINLDIATRVKESLVGEGYEVDLLKEFDPRLVGYRSIVLVSIHADSCDYINDQARGFKVSAAVSTFYPEKAARLTNCLRTRYSEATNLPYHAGSITSDMTSYHAFYEIHNETTAAIIETGFMNLDRQILTEQPNLVADGVTNGILCFVRNEDLSNSSENTEPGIIEQDQEEE